VIIGLVSVSGSPGVTTTALGLTLAWPRASLLVDTDAQQAILAGYLAGQEPAEPGLSQVIASTKRTGDLREAIWLTARPLPDDNQTTRRLLLPGPAAPWERSAINSRWGSLASAFGELSSAAGLDVIIDLGRLQTPASADPSSVLPTQLLEGLDVLAVMLHPTLKSVAAARRMLGSVTESTNRLGISDRLGLLLRTPAGVLSRDQAHIDTFTPREVAHATQVPVLGTIATDPAAAAVLSDGMPRTKKWDSSRLARSHRRLAHQLSQQVEARETVNWEEGDA